jgi:exonuclease SbcD
VYVANRPDIFKIPTPGGDIQIVSLPWLRRSALLAREEMKNLNLEQVTRMMQEALTRVIAEKAAAIDPAVPAVLAAHVLVGDAKVGRGSESLMSIGQEPAVLLSNIALPAFDYVALGHIHKHQVLAEKPPVVYAGSLERVDFGEENEDKGFYAVNIQTDDKTGNRQVTYDFHPTQARRFLTVKVELKEDEADPTAAVLNAIAGQGEKARDAIVRLNISVPSSLEGQLRNNDIKEALKETHSFTIAREIQRETRLRLGSRPAEDITPLDALKAYLETQNVSPERRKTLLEYGEKLIQTQE